MTDWSRFRRHDFVSINKNTKKIVMTSLMRDIYLYVQGVGYNRLNVAYAMEGRIFFCPRCRRASGQGRSSSWRLISFRSSRSSTIWAAWTSM